jgi:hypothetical protein
MSEFLQELFPGLQATPFQLTSPADRNYNCIGWAANDSSNWWWPEGDAPTIYWPVGVPSEVTLDTFAALFEMLGYIPGGDDALESGTEKVALFADAAGIPTHAARQLASGRWTSKLGEAEDIEHELRALEGEIYGTVALILKRGGAATPRA